MAPKFKSAPEPPLPLLLRDSASLVLLLAGDAEPADHYYGTKRMHWWSTQWPKLSPVAIKLRRLH